MYRVSQNYLMTANFSTQRPLNFIWKVTILKKNAGVPNDNFRKISVRKTIWDLEFSEHLL